MLCFSREIGQRFVMTLPGGQEVWVTVVAIYGNTVRLGVEAAKDIRVNREEIHRRILAAEAAKGAA